MKQQVTQLVTLTFTRFTAAVTFAALWVGFIDPVMGDSVKSYNNGDRPSLKPEGSDSYKGSFEVVVLSTFPRSGTSWVRELMRGATGYDFGASSRTVVQHYDTIQLLRGRNISTSSQIAVAAAKPGRKTPASSRDIARFLMSVKLLKQYSFQRMVAKKKIGTGAESKDGHSGAYKLSGIKPSILQRHSESHGSSVHEHECANLPRIRWGEDALPIPPLLIKSHFPAIDRSGPGLAVVTESDRRIHLIRNPWDNLMSTFHGSSIATKADHAVRWSQFVDANTRNKTTPQFTSHLKEQLAKYIRFHQHWRDFEQARPQQSIYIHYETLCKNVSAVLPAILRFAHMESVDMRGSVRLKCAVKMLPCSAEGDMSQRYYPEHLQLYTDEQSESVRKATEPLLSALGYRISGTGRSVSVTVDPDLSRESVLRFAGI
eukprot:m.318236 g.318236  ORF g.318236 m.318236 type:complete len:430 (-) comp16444_c0_seq9:22-1311(-)